jgi:hypothetical protein
MSMSQREDPDPAKGSTRAALSHVPHQSGCKNGVLRNHEELPEYPLPRSVRGGI